jgi:hypothetical protein
MAEVLIEVADLTGVPGTPLSAELQWLGETRRIALVDDGSVAGDVPGDGVRTGRAAGDAVRLLPVRLLTTGGREAWSGVEALDADGGSLAFELVSVNGEIHAERVPAPGLGQPRPGAEQERIVVDAAWICIVMVIVAALVASRSGIVVRRG